MVTKVQSWGKSQCLRLSKRIIEDARVSVGDEVDVAVRDGIIVLTPVKRSRGKVSLRKLVARIPKGHRPEEAQWGAPVGQEEAPHVQTAKVFQNGRSQAIRLPMQFRVNSGEVYLKATAEGFLVIPRDPWEVFAEGVQNLSDDFMAERRQQPKIQRRSWRS